MATTTDRTANEILRDLGIQRAHALERFKGGEVKRILGMLNRDVYPAIIDELQRRLSRNLAAGRDLGLESTKRLQDLAEAIDALIQEGLDRAEDRLTRDIHGLAKLEAKTAADHLSRAAGFELDLALPSPGLLKTLATERPFAGSNLAEHFESLTAASQKHVRRAVTIGMTSGETFAEIAARVQGAGGALDLSRHQVKSVVGAAVQHAGHSARMATYRENADVIKAEVWTATLDSRTCEQCMGYDGQEFPVGEGPQPPAHLGPCRCVRVPVLKSWRELGLDIEDGPVGPTRASMDGEVPDSVTYGEWLKGQPDDVQNEALGPKRAELFRAGEPIEKFTDDAGRLLTLKELEAMGA